MDLTPSPQETAFRTGLRTWLGNNLPAPFKGRPYVEDPDYIRYLKAWQRKLAEDGWLGVTWPSEHGGRELGPAEQTILLEELARENAPPILGFIGLGIIGPAIVGFGTKEQKQRYLRKMLFGEEIWVAGFSEPNAGSDLGLQTDVGATYQSRDGLDSNVDAEMNMSLETHLKAPVALGVMGMHRFM
jgi:alkylation response protein AidB-like acyl-CoA dehydrogenase